MDRATRIAIIEHAIRWGYNMLTEVASNHGKILGDHARAKLQRAVHALGECLMIGNEADE